MKIEKSKRWINSGMPDDVNPEEFVMVRMSDLNKHFEKLKNMDDEEAEAYIKEIGMLKQN